MPIPNQDEWRRIAATVREYESALRSGGMEPGATPMPGSSRVHVKVTGPKVAMVPTSLTGATSTTTSTTTTTTSTTTTSTGTSTTPGAQTYCYPGVIVVRDLRKTREDVKWQDTPNTVWVEEVNGEDLQVGMVYSGDPVRHYNGRALVMVSISSGNPGGGGEVRTLRIDGPYIQDDPGTVMTPSILRYYPATDVTDLTPAGWPDTGPQVWWCSWYGYGDVPPIAVGKPYTVVVCDGSAAVDAVYKGFSYAPDDGSGTPPSGQNRPVYASTHYARARRMRCETDETGAGPKETLGGS